MSESDGAPDDTPAEPPEDHEPFEHPINPRTMAVLLAVVLLVAAVVLIGVTVSRRSDAPTDAPPATAPPATTAAVPEPAATTTTATTPAPSAPVAPVTVAGAELPAPPYEVAQARGPGAVAVYSSPGTGTPVRTLPASIVVGAEQQATVPLVMLVRSHPQAGWLEVYLPVRPNGSTGFIRSSDVTLSRHDFRIEISLGAFRLKALDGDRTILDAPIAEAAETTPTPGGLYYTTMLLKPPDPSGPYGTYAYGLSGYSDTLTAFAGGDGQLGIHGTNEPEKMGQKVSHGCIRLRNEDIDQLAAVLPLGVPVMVNS